MLQRLSKVIRRPMFWHGTHHHDSNDATKRLFDTVSSTVKGIQQINYVVEHDPKLTAEEKSKMKQFLIYRYDPADENDFPKYVSYYVDLKKIPPMYLDALLYYLFYKDFQFTIYIQYFINNFNKIFKYSNKCIFKLNK